MSVVTSRSWSIMHNGLSSALLLGLLGGTARDTEVRDLQGKILESYCCAQEVYTDYESNTLHTGGHLTPETGNVGRFPNVAKGAW
ncbi:uncharacterized protein EAE97_011632 [Botrytis byssoidea]|uniref:Uncharacterized protein n=1 Tax=Botrytis byssoidea TaxID=139641 RepID=A0A9P5HQE3_9HELO|nr:uncharacterized protein EAE97_011632 [Botrytis byssoidea]KAF7919714.1 hypothetical protein EAE97_011632 [Botrytis byssoidea]